ncbi:MAG: hypothetical protein IKX30_02720 [Victivallales bacterium]|nr:hypothetical protein [Victivallales bacterium]
MAESHSEPWETLSRRHRAGDVPGGCRLEKLLHDDGVCEIFRAFDEVEGRTCRVKCFGRRVVSYDDAAVIQAMKHEQRLSEHAELGLVLGAELEESVLYSHVTCAYHEGRPLADILRNEGVMEESRCVEIAKGILSKLEAFEKAGVGHGSLTLDGVLLDDDGQIWLGSCGFPGMTGRYACQEARNGEYDVVSDFYSVGVMLYELLCNESPFGAAGQVTPLWERRPDVSSDICLFIHRMMSEKRDVRPLTVQEALHGLSNVDSYSRLSPESLCARLKKMEETPSPKHVKVMKGVSSELRSGPKKTGGSWFLKLVAAVLILLSFGVGYGWANSSQGSFRMPKPLSFLEPALKKITHAREEEAVADDETAELSAEEPKEVASAGLAADDEDEDEEEEEDTPVEDVAPSVDEKIKEAVANTVQKEDVVIEEGEPMNRWAVDENDNDNAAEAEEKKPEQELSVEEAAELQKQLEAALKKRNAKDVKTLLNAGAKLDWVSEDGTSLMQQACARGHWDAVEFMLKQGANPNWRPKVPGEKFKLPLQIALDNGKKTYPALLMLLKYKADPQLLFDTALYFTNTEDGKKQPIRKDTVGIVALCQYDYLRDNRTAQLEALSAWLDARKGALPDELAAALLTNAIDQKMSKGFLKMVLQRIKSMKSPKYGSVLLAAMKHKNRIELLGNLKERGIQVNNVCELEKDGVLVEETPLYYAVRTKCEEPVVRWLLANGASVKWTDADGKTVMDLDADPKIKQLLLNAKQGKKVTQDWSGDLYTTGTTTIKTNMPWDADLNAVTVKGEHADWITATKANDQTLVDADVDFYWRYDKDAKTLTLEPRNGCEVLVMTGNLTPFDQVEVSYIAKQKFSDTTLSYSKEEGSPLKAGSIILFRTSRGNFGKFRVIRYEDEVIDKKKRRNVSLMLHWVVYHLQEEEVRQSHSKRTIW